MWPVDDVRRMTVLEKGPLRGVLRIERAFLNSVIIQDIVIYTHLPRIDFQTRIDWKEKDLVLKAAFPVDVRADRAAYEIQFGYIERNTHWNTTWDTAKFEVPAHKWADLSEDGYGVSLLNDCKYGYDIKDGQMRLTLLRCGTVPNTDADKEMHEFTYSLLPHRGDWRAGRTVQEAFDLNCPLLGKMVTRQDGTLPEKMALVKVDQDHVIASVVKQAEDGGDLVLRVYEAYNRRGNVKIELPGKIGRLTECNLIERDDREMPFAGNEFTFTIKPLEIKTFRISLEKWT
jgi:alpha-mannosidase